MKTAFFVDGPLQGESLPVDDWCTLLNVAGYPTSGAPGHRAWSDIIQYTITTITIVLNDDEEHVVCIGTCTGNITTGIVHRMIMPLVISGRHKYQPGVLAYYRVKRKGYLE